MIIVNIEIIIIINKDNKNIKSSHLNIDGFSIKCVSSQFTDGLESLFLDRHVLPR